MICPICGRKEEGVLLMCSSCWWASRPKDRALIAGMHRRGQDTSSKLEQMKRHLQELRAAAPFPGPGEEIR